MIKSTKEQKGYVLMSSMGLAVLMLLVGGTSIYMVQMGSETNQSERKYQIAKYAADYALNKAIKAVVDSTFAKPCGVNSDAKSYTSSEETLLNSKGTYSYKTQSDEGDVNCMIMAYGNYNGSRVVKSAIIPVKSDPGTGNGAMSAKTIANLTLNGENASIGSQCGPGAVYENASTSVENTLNEGQNVLGDPKTLKSNNVNVFDSFFGPGISDWPTLSSSLDSIISSRASSVADTCKVTPPTNEINNTNCNTAVESIFIGQQLKGKKLVDVFEDRTVINCSGGVNKKIDISTCAEVVISAGVMNINNDMKSTVLTVNTSNNLTINAPTKGLLSTDGDLNVSPVNGNVNDRQTNAMEGIFIGNRANNLNLSGNETIYGLFFIGSGSLSFNLNGTDKLAGALAVNGSVDFNRNGGGNGSPNVEFDPSKIMPWRTYYGNNFLDPLSCSSGTPPSKKAMAERTKMSLF